jgi:hypothetical protein
MEDWERAFSDMSEQRTRKPVLVVDPRGDA